MSLGLSVLLGTALGWLISAGWHGKIADRLAEFKEPE